MKKRDPSHTNKMKKLWERYKAHDKKVKEAQENFKVFRHKEQIL